MPAKITLSENSSEKIEQLSRKLILRRNIICRLAVGESLTRPESVENLKSEDNEGYEFNRYTLTGDDDDLFKALVIQHEREKIDDDEYFRKYLKNHIERGVEQLFKKLQKSSSGIEFLTSFFAEDHL